MRMSDVDQPNAGATACPHSGKPCERQVDPRTTARVAAARPNRGTQFSARSCFLGCVLAMTCIAFGCESVRSEPNWHSLASSAAKSLAEALDDTARGRPAMSKLRAAIEIDDRLLDSAPLTDRDRARILYNRGLAHLTLGDAPAAILDLRRSDALAPAREATRRELAAARAKLAPPPTAPANTVAAIPAQPERSLVATARDAVQRIPESLPWFATLIAAGLGWNLLAARLFSGRPPVRITLAASAAAAFIIAAATAGMVMAQRSLRPDLPEVVVIADACTPRQGPDEVAYAASTLGGHATIPRGTELVVVEARALPERPDAIAWVRVREAAPTNSGASGPTVWIPTSSLGWVRPPPSAAFGAPPTPASPLITGS